MWRNRGMGVASISSIAAVLVILGIVLILILSINNFVANTQEKLDEIEVFLEEDIAEEDMKLIRDKLEEQKGVIKVEFRSEEDALDLLREKWEDDAYLLEGLEEENPLPASYVVNVEDLQYADDVVHAIEDTEGVHKVNYHKDAIEKLLTTAAYIEKGGLAIIIILVAVSIFIISNTIKLTVNSRSREINIMKYVGATNSYIKGPFIIEGVSFGILGALVSLAITYFGYGYLFEVINQRLYDFFQIMLVAPTMIFADIAIIFLAIGAGIGALGSVLAMKRFLNV